MDKRSGGPIMLDYSVPLLSADIDVLGLVHSAGGILVRALHPRGPLASPQPTHGAHSSSKDGDIVNLNQPAHSVVGLTATHEHLTHHRSSSSPGTTHSEQPGHVSVHAASGEPGHTASTEQESGRRHALRSKPL